MLAGLRQRIPRHASRNSSHVLGIDTVVVELALQGTHKGPLAVPGGFIPPTGKPMNAPCCDVFRLVDGKIKTFNCYWSAAMVLAQLGVLGNLEGAVAMASWTGSRAHRVATVVIRAVRSGS